jgi:uncharacterized protein (DUF486 family)
VPLRSAAYRRTPSSAQALNVAAGRHFGAVAFAIASGMTDASFGLSRMKTILLLVLSNTFMNLAWYGHLKFKGSPLWLAILASWGIALFEYVFQVPANRIGSEQWTVPQLKVLQECITLVIFTFVAFALFQSPMKWNYLVSYGFIVGAVFFAFKF